MIETESEAKPAAGGRAIEQLLLADEYCRRKYSGLELLGASSEATAVFKTHDNVAGHEIALKATLRCANEKQAREQKIRFQREVYNARQLRSPFAVSTYGAHETDALLLRDLEYVFGPDLQEDLDARAASGERYTVEEALDVAICVASALQEAHALDLLHRDVKPSNILLPRTPGAVRAKLGDFGVSRFADAARITQTGASPGTPMFQAPEVLDGKEHTKETDVYSFATCLYLMLSGNRNMYGLPPDAPVSVVSDAARKGLVTPVAVHASGPLPQDLVDLVTQCLSKQPADRWPMTRIVEELKRLRGALEHDAVRPAASKPAAPSGGAAAFATPGRLAAGLGVVLALGVAALVAGRGSSTRSLSPPATLVAVGDAMTSTATAGGPPPPFTVELDRISAVLTNNSPTATRALRIVLVDPQGVEHTNEIPPLAAREDAILSLEDFDPPVSGRLRAGETTLRGDPPALVVRLLPAN